MISDEQLEEKSTAAEKSKTRRITKKMIMIWSACMVAIIVVAFSIMSLIMVSKKIHYSFDINFENLHSVRYVNTTESGKDLYANEFPSHINAIEKILDLLDEAGKTNRFKEFFWQEDGEPKLTRRPTYLSTITNQSGGIYITITFNLHQYYIENANNSFSFQTPESTSNNKVKKIIIPLGEVKNKFTEQTWYIFVDDDTNSSYAYTTYGNYHALAEHVGELSL